MLAGGIGTKSTPRQLVLLLSDGRFDRENKDRLRNLVREMNERGELLVLIGEYRHPSGASDSCPGCMTLAWVYLMVDCKEALRLVWACRLPWSGSTAFADTF